MGFSNDQYPSAGEMARQNAGKAANAAENNSKMIKRILGKESAIEARVRDMLRVLPELLDLTDVQVDKLNKAYPLSSFIGISQANPAEDQTTRKDSDRFGVMGLDCGDLGRMYDKRLNHLR